MAGVATLRRPRPACPWHPDSKVWFDGKYGAPGHRRQRYRCVPKDGSPWHRFTETLPRMHGGTGECLECERGYESHEGPPAGRKFHFTTRDVAFALMEVGKGAADRRAGWRMRQRSGRVQYGSKNNDGNTVADWVELFAPAIFETKAPTEWPHIVAFDDIPFRIKVRDPLTGQPVQRGVNAFHVHAAYGWNRKGDGQVLALHAAPGYGYGAGFPYWLEFLRDLDNRLEGQPWQIVSDEDQPMLRAIDRVWKRGSKGAPIHMVCHWHLRDKLSRMLDTCSVRYPDPLRDMLMHKRDYLCSCALCNRTTLDDFEAEAQRRQIRKLVEWLDRKAPMIRWQLDYKQRKRVLTSVGALEQVLVQVRNMYEDRRGMITNRERMNRRLMLVQLEQNGQANESHYAKVIRDELLANGGFGGTRFLLDDPPNGPSLRVA